MLAFIPRNNTGEEGRLAEVDDDVSVSKLFKDFDALRTTLSNGLKIFLLDAFEFLGVLRDLFCSTLLSLLKRARERRTWLITRRRFDAQDDDPERTQFL